MVKKRGGKNRKNKTTEMTTLKSDICKIDVDGISLSSSSQKQQNSMFTVNKSTEYLLDHQYGGVSDNHDHDQYRVVAEYVKTIQPLLDTILQQQVEIQRKERQPFNIAEERNLLIGRIFKEFKGRVS